VLLVNAAPGAVPSLYKHASDTETKAVDSPSLIDETTLLVHFSNANDELINIKE
jgi:hypothetical protein